MRYPYSCLRQYLQQPFSPEELILWLDTLGLSPQVIKSDPEDLVLEIETPANRPDLLSLIGLARAIAPFGRLTVQLPRCCFAEDLQEVFPVNIENIEDCLYYSCRVMRGVKVAPSPSALKDTVEKLGFRSSLNVVDLSNLVMAETGQPLHVFDLDRICKKITVRRAFSGEKIITLDGRQRLLDNDILVIADEEKSVALAGIMGGANSEVTNQTVNLLIESAVFSPGRIRRGSKKLGLSTEAALRFEKGIDPQTACFGLERLISLIKEMAGGHIGPVSWTGEREKKLSAVELDAEHLQTFLGSEIPGDFLTELFSQSGFSVTRKGNVYQVTIPSFRNDIQDEVDLIEEVAKYWTYERIPSCFPSVEIIPTPTSRQYLLLERIQDIMMRLGCTEVITSSLIPEDWEKFCPDKCIPIVNPLSQNASRLRSCLIPGLLEVVRFNLTRGRENMQLFELGTVYQYQESAEKLSLGLVVYRDKAFFTLKGIVESFFAECGIFSLEWKSSTGCLENLGQLVEIEWKKGKTGYLVLPGEKVLKFFDIGSAVAVGEIFVEGLEEQLFRIKKFVPPPRFPSSRRDFSFIFSENVVWPEVEKILRNLHLPVESIDVFDTYQGEKISPGCLSISFSVIFRHPERTLLAEEVEEFTRLIAKTLEENFSARIRQ